MVLMITTTVCVNPMVSCYRIHHVIPVSLIRHQERHRLQSMNCQMLRWKKDRFVLMTIRSHDQYNTTIYGLHDRYRGVHGNRRVLFMNALDMSEHGLKTRDIVNITSHYGEQKLHSKHWILVPYEIPRRKLSSVFPRSK